MNGRIAFDTNVSAQVQGDIQALAAQLESLIGQREADVARAMADFRADGVDAEYQSVESRWSAAAQETKAIITLVRSTLGLNDETATAAINSARNAVQGIG